MKNFIAKTMSGYYYTGTYRVHTDRALQTIKSGQCGVAVDGLNEILISYITPVAGVIHTGGYRWFCVRGLYSATTRRHISAFAAEFGVSYYMARELALSGYIYNLDTGEVKFAGYTNIEKAIERALSATAFYTERIN